MKKLLLFALTLSFGVAVTAQTKKATVVPDKIAKQSVFLKRVKPNDNQLPASFTHIPYKVASVLSLTDVQIGSTEYDLQTNASVQNRVVKYADGTISAIWTMSLENPMTGSFADRGTGYNYFNGTSWQAMPTARIENVRTGFPSMTVANGKEVVICHNGSGLTMSTRTKGTGSWTTSSIPFSTNNSLTWPRAMGAGLNSQTLHIIATADPGQVAKGMYYSRSTDGGATWVTQDTILPGVNPVTEMLPTGGDDYVIDVKGDTVGIVTGDMTTDVVLIKSFNGGKTWTSQKVWQHQIPLWKTDTTGIASSSDANGDGLPDTLTVTDGNYALVIGNDGVFHVFMGITKILRAATDAASSFSDFYTTDGVVYWNSKKPTIKPGYDFYADTSLNKVGYMLDLNGSDTLFNTDIAAGSKPFGDYSFMSVSSMSSAAIGADGAIYCTYSSVVQGTDYGDGRGFRNIYAIKSTDNGATWSYPVNITPDDNAECTYGSLARTVDANLYMVYQKSDNPGIFLADVTAANPHIEELTNINFVKISNDLVLCTTPPTPTITLKVDTLISSATTGNQWYKNNAMIPGASGQKYTITSGGKYYDIVKQVTCISDTSNIITSDMGIKEISNISNISAYPNPFHGNTNISLSLVRASEVTITISNMLGQKVYETNKGLVNAGTYTYTIEGNMLQSGVYYFTVKAGSSSVTNKMIVE